MSVIVEVGRIDGRPKTLVSRAGNDQRATRVERPVVVLVDEDLSRLITVVRVITLVAECKIIVAISNMGDGPDLRSCINYMVLQIN